MTPSLDSPPIPGATTPRDYAPKGNRVSAFPATIARCEDGTAWPRRPEEVPTAYANELGMDVRVLWLHGFVLWIENEPVLDEQSQADIREAMGRLAPREEAELGPPVSVGAVGVSDASGVGI